MTWHAPAALLTQSCSHLPIALSKRRRVGYMRNYVFMPFIISNDILHESVNPNIDKSIPTNSRQKFCPLPDDKGFRRDFTFPNKTTKGFSLSVTKRLGKLSGRCKAYHTCLARTALEAEEEHGCSQI